MVPDESNVIERHPKYFERLADVYLEKFHKFGYDTALAWYKGFIPEDMQNEVREVIKVKVGDTS